eukprot:2241789-Prymnesium_polylepis.1
MKEGCSPHAGPPLLGQEAQSARHSAKILVCSTQMFLRPHPRKHPADPPEHTHFFRTLRGWGSDDIDRAGPGRRRAADALVLLITGGPGGGGTEAGTKGVNLHGCRVTGHLIRAY